MSNPGAALQAPDAGVLRRRPKVTERIALSGTATGGALMVMETTIAPGGLVAPVHVHTHEDETIFVVEGRVGARLGDDELVAEPGSVLFGPRGVPHSFWNGDGETARLVMVITPGTLDGYFHGLSAVASGSGPERLIEYASGFGIDLRLDTLPDLTRRHGVVLF